MSREHGTHACYVWGPEPGAGDGCRCEPCRAAAAAYERERTRRVAPAYVSANSARRHIEWLRTQGVGLKTVAATSGVSHGALTKLVYGDSQRGMAPSKRIRPETRDRILAVKPSDVADGALIDAAPTWADIDTLLERGWTKVAIARGIGQTGPGLQVGRHSVTARVARAVAALLDQPVPPRRSRHGAHPVTPPEAEPAPTPIPRAEPTHLHEVVDTLTPDVLARGACRAPDVPTWLFFPERGDNETLRRAQAVCATCPVAAECLEHALANNELYGVWGGTTGKQRARLARERRRLAS